MAFRSLLFVPGARPDRFEKALAAGADAVCIDLEDAVAPPGKADARAATLAFLSQPRTGGPALGLRINSPRTAWGAADIAALAESDATPAFVMVPKAAHAEELVIIGEVLGAKRAPLVPIVESGLGLTRAASIAAAPGVEGVLFGGADFSADLGATLDWEPMLHARGVLAAACAAAGVDLLDVPYLDVEDDAGLIETTKRAKAMGFTGRACIHPKQIAGVHTAFTPTPDELARARRVLAAFEDAKGGAALLDGKLVELPVIRAARRVLAASGEA